MTATIGVILCLAYGLGLFFMSLLVRHLGCDITQGAVISGLGMLGCGVGAAIALPSRWRRGPRASVWLLAGAIALLAILNYAWQWPRAGAQDIGQWIERSPERGEQALWGQIQNMPSQNRNGQGRFWLQVEQVRLLDGQGEPLGEPERAEGKVYATAPWEMAQALYPGQSIELNGTLYRPSAPKNPNGFDFQAYLQDNGSFAGFAASRIQPQRRVSPPRWRLWQLRKRIATAQEKGLGIPAGPLVSAMTLGRQATSNLPYDLQDNFMQAGLAHTLAASGFQVSLMLGVLMALLKRQSGVVKVVAGTLTLLLFVGLAGAEPSVMRAALMGGGVLIGLALERKVKPLGCLLVAVTLLLLVNPLWIDSIGFRLSVMATFGLMVTATPLTQRLDWLPGTLAALVAVPIAAYLWTVPLQLYYFQTLSFYSILLNMAVTPLVTVLSLGGMASAIAAASLPSLGSFLASLLYLPTHLLIALVNWEVQLPGNSFATGQLSLVQMLGLYGLLFLAWGQAGWRRRWGLGMAGVLLAFAPLWYHTSTASQITVLAAGQDAVLVAQHERQAVLINGSEPKTAFYTLLPFLRQGGINQLDWAVALPLPGHASESWQTVVSQTPVETLLGLGNTNPCPPCTTGIRSFQPLAAGQSHPLAAGQIQRFGTEHPILRFTLVESHPWLMLPKLSLPLQQFLAQAGTGLASEVLWWDGSPLAAALLDVVQPQVAIASARSLSPKTEEQLRQRGIQVFVTERDGAITWRPETGFRAYLHTRHRQGVEIDAV